MPKRAFTDANSKISRKRSASPLQERKILEKKALPPEGPRDEGGSRHPAPIRTHKHPSPDSSLDLGATARPKTGNRFHQKLLQILNSSDSFMVVTHTGRWTSKMKGLKMGSAYPRSSREDPPIRGEESMASAPREFNYIFNFFQKDGALNRDVRALNHFNCEIYSRFSLAYEQCRLVFPNKAFADLFRKTAFFSTVDCSRVMGALARSLSVDPGAEAIFCLHAEVPNGAPEKLLECLSMKLFQAATQSAEICRNSYGVKPSGEVQAPVKLDRDWAAPSSGVLDYRIHVMEG